MGPVTPPERIEYDEFGLFHENAAEYGLPFDGPPAVVRRDIEVDGDRRLVQSMQLWLGLSPFAKEKPKRPALQPGAAA